MNNYTKLENSLEYVFDNIGWIDSNTVDEERYKLITCKTHHKLPMEIRNEILDKVLFISDVGWGCIHELYFPVPPNINQIKQIIITLNFSNMEHEGASEDVMMDCVAHECAHVILGHHSIEKQSDHSNERKADELSKEWGFKGTYSEKRLKEIEKQ